MKLHDVEQDGAFMSCSFGLAYSIPFDFYWFAASPQSSYPWFSYRWFILPTFRCLNFSYSVEFDLDRRYTE